MNFSVYLNRHVFVMQKHAHQILLQSFIVFSTSIKVKNNNISKEATLSKLILPTSVNGDYSERK